MTIFMHFCVAEVWLFCFLSSRFLHLRHQRVFDGSQRLPGRRALHQHRRLVPVPERGQLWDRLWTHRQQQLQRSVTLTPLCREALTQLLAKWELEGSNPGSDHTNGSKMACLLDTQIIRGWIRRLNHWMVHKCRSECSSANKGISQILKTHHAHWKV